MILPNEGFIGNSQGEKRVWEIFREFLPSDYISFHNYNLSLKQADVILLVPDLGVLLIEIKGFLAKNIFDVPDNSIIRMKNSPPIPSPYNQAVKYRNILLNDYLIKNSINDIYVVQCVCYPYISADEFVQSGLNKICVKELSILKEDLINQQVLIDKFRTIFERAYELINMPELVRYGFKNERLNQVGEIISPGFRNTAQTVKTPSIENTLVKSAELPYYSNVSFIKNRSPENLMMVTSLVRDWANGAKIYLFSEDQEVLDYATNQIRTIIQNRNLEKNQEFSVSTKGSFNFTLGKANLCSPGFSIKNGEDIDKYVQELISLDTQTPFNLNQYKIEHAPLTDIIVKAGAGTGKTFSVIARINYLIWKKGYEPYDLAKAIAMITFTNESADSMRDKLAERFMNQYQLVGQTKILDYIEAIEDMHIATIHTMAKTVLSSYSSVLGLGKDFKIVSGKHKREKLLNKHFNQFIEKRGKDHWSLDGTTNNFHIQRRLLEVLEKFDNKNIEITNLNTLDFGKPIEKEVGVIDPEDRKKYNDFRQLLEVLRKTEIEFSEDCDMNNSISLGNLIRKMKSLSKFLDQNSQLIKTKIDFLFVDEFQDTDDVQIDLVKTFQKLFSYHLFVVGDIKQCIYRFRGAEVKAFDTLLDKNDNQFSYYTLNKNYRTDTLLLNRFNRLFSLWNDKSIIEYSKDDLLVGTKQISNELRFYNISVSQQDFDEVLVNQVIHQRKQLGPKGKIAILVRYNSQINQVKQIFQKRNIYVETEVGGELFKIDPTIDVYKLVMALKNYKSKKHLFNLYTTSFIDEQLNKVELFEHSDDKIDYFKDHLPLRLGKFDEYLERVRREPVLKVLKDIILDIKPWTIYAKNICFYNHGEDIIHESTDHVSRVAASESYYIRNLDLLFEKLIISNNTDYLTLNKINDFLEVMIMTRRDEKARETYDIEKSDAKIICTTVHKAKGLEFETVVLPYVDFDFAKAMELGDVNLIYTNNEIGFQIKHANIHNGIGTNRVLYTNDIYAKYKENETDDQNSEETRILYVAITRAIKTFLYFSLILPDKKESRTWRKLLEGDKS